MVEEYAKRYTDHLDRASDHDLLIKLNTKMDSVCRALTEKTTSIDHSFEMLNKSCAIRKTTCEAAIDKKVPGTTFWTLVIILTGVLGVLFTTAITNRVDITSNYANLLQAAKQIEKLEGHK